MAKKNEGPNKGKAKLDVRSLPKHADGDAAKVKGGSSIVTDLRARAIGDGSVFRGDVLSPSSLRAFRG